MQGKSRKRVRIAILAVLLTTLGMIGIGAIAASQADAATTPLSVTLNSCGAGNTATFDPATGNVVLSATKTPAATECGTSYNTAGVGYADAAVNGVAGTALPAAAPTFTVKNDTQSDFVFDFEMNGGDRIWGFANGNWSIVGGAQTNTWAQILTAESGKTVKEALFFVSGDATYPDVVTVSGLQYASQTLNGGGTVSLTRPDDVDNVLGTAIVPIQLSATTNVSDQHLVYSAPNLPAGLSIDQNKGVITGTPTHTGGTLVTVTATNDYGQSGSQVFAVRVASHAYNPVPYVYGGQVVTVNNNRATVTWNASDKGWPDSQNKCEEVWISGYGFGAWNPADPTNPGTAHVGFTCVHDGSNVNFGYLRGLAAGHTYALRIVPATGVYGNNKPIPGAHVAYVDVFTTR